MYKNIFSGDLVTVTGAHRNPDGVEWVEYEKVMPVQVGPQVISHFRKPKYAFEKCYSPCKN